jgi:hypothetical protein
VLVPVPNVFVIVLVSLPMDSAILVPVPRD